MSDEPYYSVAQHVAWVDAVELGDDRAEVYVGRVPDGPPLLLAGTAWAIWLSVVAGGSPDDVTARAAELTGAQPSDIAHEVADFLRSLLEAGLVRRSAPEESDTLDSRPS